MEPLPVKLLERLRMYYNHYRPAHNVLEGGTDVRYIQAFLDHNSLQTSMRYTHVSQMKLETIQSPLDKLNL